MRVAEVTLGANFLDDANQNQTTRGARSGKRHVYCTIASTTSTLLNLNKGRRERQDTAQIGKACHSVREDLRDRKARQRGAERGAFHMRYRAYPTCNVGSVPCRPELGNQDLIS